MEITNQDLMVAILLCFAFICLQLMCIVCILVQKEARERKERQKSLDKNQDNESSQIERSK